MLTLFGVVLGVGTFVGVLGLTSTVSGQIDKRFTALLATEVTVKDLTTGKPATLHLAFPPDAEKRARTIKGVRAAGVLWPIHGSEVGRVTSVPSSVDDNHAQTPVYAASPGLFRAVHAKVAVGRTFDVHHDSEAQHVVVLGAGAALRLNVTLHQNRAAVFLGGLPMSVVGVLDDVERYPELLNAVIVPRQTAEALWGLPEDPAVPPKMIIDTEIGAAHVVARQAAVALRPDAPEVFAVYSPPDPRTLRGSIRTDLAGLFLILAGVCLIIGAGGIANTMLISVLERVPEIGLRRALGARSVHIVVHVLAESGVLGALGGLIGGGIAVLMVVLVSLAQGWTPLLDLPVILAAPLLGLVVGLLSGLYPSIRAARIEPVNALRRAD